MLNLSCVEVGLFVLPTDLHFRAKVGTLDALVVSLWKQEHMKESVLIKEAFQAVGAEMCCVLS